MRAVLSGALALLVLATIVCPPPTLAQAPTGARQPLKPEELEQLVSPIALYPDALVSQVLMASTYPLDIVHAARFAKQNAGLKGEPLNAALKQQPWDDSIKSLVSFPPVLTMMSDRLDWTQKIGDAFLAQPKDLMDAVQRLRAKAVASGYLKTTEQQKIVVEQSPAVIRIEPASPQVVYVPVYNPTVVYGVWAYPAYPPYYYYPPGYVATATVLSFGVGLAVGAALWGDCDWHHGYAHVHVDHYTSFTKNVNVTHISTQRIARVNATPAQGANPGAWQHDPARRGAVPYRDQRTAEAYGRGQPTTRERQDFRGRTPERATPATMERQTSGSPGTMDRQAPGGPATTDRQAPGSPSTMDRQGSGAGRDQGSFENHGQAGAFDGIGQGRQTADFSARGASSLDSSRSSVSRASRSGSAAASGGGRRR